MFESKNLKKNQIFVEKNKLNNKFAKIYLIIILNYCLKLFLEAL
jgi:hypothetical protein